MTPNPEIEKQDEKRLDAIWRSSWRLADRRPPHEWLEDNVLGIPYSPVPGRFRADHSPWIKEPLAEFANDRTSLISIIAAIQSGKTTVIELGACWAIHNAPAPMLWLDQTDPDAKDQCVNRLQPLFEHCPPVRAVLPHKAKRKNDGWTFYNGMPLWVKGGHNKTNLQRRSIRWLLVDESWRLPPGHMAEAEARVTAFGWLGKRVFSSQFGELNDDTHQKFNETDQREWHVKCLHCGELQPYKWDFIRYDKEAKNDDGSWNYEEIRRSTRYECRKCHHRYEDTDQNRRMLSDDRRGAQFIPMNPSAAPGKVGFHWNGLVSTSWGGLVEMFLRAKEEARKGDFENLKVFYQKRLAIAFDEFTDDFKMDIESSGYKPRDEWDDEGGFAKNGSIRRRGDLLREQEIAQEAEEEIARSEGREAKVIRKYYGPLRFATVDVQKGYFYILIRAWTPDGSSRLLHWQKVGSYDELDRVRAEWGVLARLVFVDAGYDPHGKKQKDSYGVYRACADRGYTALMGHRSSTFPHQISVRENGKLVNKRVDRFYSPRRRVVIGTGKVASVFYWSNLNVKDMLAALRANQDPGAGATWEVYDGIEDEYLHQMESEVRVFEKGSWKWSQIGRTANHLWDCEAMQIVAALMLKLIGRESVPEPEK